MHLVFLISYYEVLPSLTEKKQKQGTKEATFVFINHKFDCAIPVLQTSALLATAARLHLDKSVSLMTHIHGHMQIFIFLPFNAHF